MVRPGNNPKRRIIVRQELNDLNLESIAKCARYVGSGHHKLYPADYGFERTSPRPDKTLCDASRAVSLAEASELLKRGILLGMVSGHLHDAFPKYVWAVDEGGIAYEAKTERATPGIYHGYPLQREDAMRRYILEAWNIRCQKT